MDFLTFYPNLSKQSEEGVVAVGCQGDTVASESSLSSVFGKAGILMGGGACCRRKGRKGGGPRYASLFLSYIFVYQAAISIFFGVLFRHAKGFVVAAENGIDAEDIASQPYENYYGREPVFPSKSFDPSAFEEVRRRLDAASSSPSITVDENTSTWNSMPALSNSDGLNATVRVVGHKFCPKDVKYCRDWQSVYVNGHLATISNPLDHMSVLPPPRGCGTLSQASDTSKSRRDRLQGRAKFGCKVAINAGFFMRHVKGVNNSNVLCDSEVKKNCACLGNLVSDGDVLQASNWLNVNFGVRDGKFVVGYLTKEEVVSKSNPFQQLVGGVIWLVRNGTNFVLESAKIENPTAQQTSQKLMENNKNSFVDTYAARTAIGYDKDGRLLIFQVDGLHGRSYVPDALKRGIDLQSFADLLIKLGFVEAINLDGGGSSTFVVDDEVDSYPSDQCREDGKDFVWERKITPIVCIHDDAKPAADDGGNGEGSASTTGDRPVAPDQASPVALVIVLLISLGFNVLFGHTAVMKSSGGLRVCCERACPVCCRMNRGYSKLGHPSGGRKHVTIDLSDLEIEIPLEEVTPQNSPTGTPETTSKKKLSVVPAKGEEGHDLPEDSF